eukprot:467998-Pelagomonas_calceolata.AAC.1
MEAQWNQTHGHNGNCKFCSRHTHYQYEQQAVGSVVTCWRAKSIACLTVVGHAQGVGLRWDMITSV